MKNLKKCLSIITVLFLTINIFCFNNIHAEVLTNKIIALYNSTKVTSDDMNAINNFIKQKNYDLIDVSNFNSAQQIYNTLKEKTKQENIKGIQIFGIDNDVQSFTISYKVLTKNNGIDGANNTPMVKTDYFYSNLENDASQLNNSFSVYDNFQNKLNINLYPKWPVARLLVTTGEYTSFFNKYNDYVKQNQFMPIVDFSCPIFATRNAADNEGVFLNKLNSFNILNSDQYKLYGNLDGQFPVSNKVLGNYSIDNFTKENENAISQFIISCHGDSNEIDKCVFDSNYKQTVIPIITSNNVNDVFSKNYYQLDLLSCDAAHNLNNNNITHQILSNGKCVDVLAASYIMANNGMNNNSDMDKDKCNLYDIYYWLIKGMYQDNLSKSQALLKAQQYYYNDIMNNTDNIYDHNYQYNLYNLMLYQHFGLLNNNDIINNGQYKYNNKILNKKNGDDININFSKNVKNCDIKIEDSNGDIFVPKYDINNNKISIKLNDFDDGEYTLFVNDAKDKNNTILNKKYQCNFLIN